ncbi:MAG: methylated-DNA--[protein]-cysteine S-methyltransferase [Sphaerochaetaceae bacterium]|nr:methylated-DNA--[protein]-cysteine S-methyltransferase [Sphaerochaetaceae bacterium]
MAFDNFFYTYPSPIGDLFITTTHNALKELRFNKPPLYFQCSEETQPFKETKTWLDIYFEGKTPTFVPPITIEGTAFQKEVWAIVANIPYGKTLSYGDIAKIIALKRNIKRMSSQAVGQGVGANPIAIIIPCHRVLGAKKELTGYAGGLDKKIFLLSLEKISFSLKTSTGQGPSLNA